MRMGIIPGGIKQYDTEKHSDGSQQRDGSAAVPDAEKELTPMEDALLMLELWDTAIRKHIDVQPRSPIHRLVKETIKRLKQPNAAGELRLPDSDARKEIK